MPEIDLHRKNALIAAIDLACQQLELTETQYEEARKRYEGIAGWLADSDESLLESVIIRPQGSARLRTTVRPLGRDEFDIDLICFLPEGHPSYHTASTIYHTVGNRIKANSTYKRMAKPMNRCWRLEYADSERFHMDITPAIYNPDCSNNGILVPDRSVRELKPSNPVAYAEEFDNTSKLIPLFKSFQSMQFSEAMARSYIEPLPDRMDAKDLLRRIVQVCKRHRDIMFKDAQGYPPISVIITTLVMFSYADSVRRPHDTPWDFVLDVVEHMPSYIQISEIGPRRYSFHIPNPTTEGENFAEKWNEDPKRAQDFHLWHQRLCADFKGLADLGGGQDQIQNFLTERLTGPETKRAFDKQVDSVSHARTSGQLSRIIGTGGIALAAGTPVRANTFFGSHPENVR